MINELDIIKYLLEEIKQEQSLFEEYKVAQRLAEHAVRKAEKEGKAAYY